MFEWTAEQLFYLLNGVPIIGTPFILVWILFWIAFMMMPMIYVIYMRPGSVVLGLLSVIMVFTVMGGMFIAMGPPIVQQEMLSECETVSTETDDFEFKGETQNVGAIDVKLCRHKDNYYEDFGEWKIK